MDFISFLRACVRKSIVGEREYRDSSGSSRTKRDYSMEKFVKAMHEEALSILRDSNRHAIQRERELEHLRRTDPAAWYKAIQDENQRPPTQGG